MLKNRMVKGTIINFDDFRNYLEFENHEIKAFCEFINDTNIEFECLLTTDYCPTSFRIKNV